jgi:dsDNA-binding SOS-regulon protein
VRDLVNKPTERYNEMIDTIKYNDTIKYKDNNNKQDNMQDELSNFLQDLKKNKNVSSEIISSNKIVSSSEIVSSSSGHSNTFSNY